VMAEHGIWMPLYWGDYFSDTLEFSTFQHGCYLLLIGAYWTRGGPLPNDPIALARICKTSCDKLARYGNPVLARFYCDGGLLKHKRLEIELLKSSDRQAAAVANGRAGGLAKSKLPHHTNTNKEVSNIVSFNGVGKENGKVTVQNPNERLARFQKWLAESPGNLGWDVVIAAAHTPPTRENLVALELCKARARELGKGWPHQWPVR